MGVTITSNFPKAVEHISSKNGKLLKDDSAEGDDRFYKNIDIKASGGYVVAPPSLHILGEEYSFAICPTVNLAERTEMPGYIISLLDAKQPTRKRNTSSKVTGTVKEGGRNDYLASKAGGLKAIGLEGESRNLSLIAINDQVCVPPLPESVVRGISEGMGQVSTKTTTALQCSPERMRGPLK